MPHNMKAVYFVPSFYGLALKLHVGDNREGRKMIQRLKREITALAKIEGKMLQ